MSDINSEKDIATVRNEVSVLKEDIARLTTTLTSLVRNEAGNAREKIEDRVSELYEDGRGLLNAASEKAREMNDELTQRIERNPTTSVLAALGIGIIIGLLSRDRR